MRKLFITALLTTGLTAAAPVVYAEGEACCSETASAITHLETAMVENFQELIKLVNKLVQAEFTFSDEILQGTARSTLINGNMINEQAKEQTNEIAQTALTATVSQTQDSLIAAAKLVKDPAKTDFKPEPQYFSLATILNISSFDESKLTQELQQAEQYIAFISGQANPVPPLDEIAATKSNPAIENYRAALGSYTAAQSVGVNTLNRMVNARIPDKSLGDAVGLNQAISPLQLEERVATTPLGSAWMQKMATASPADIQKETLFLLANMQVQLFQSNQQLEQLNATLAALQLQSLQGLNRASLSELRSKASGASR